MARIVGGFVAPHNPVMYFNPQGASQAQSDACYGAYAEMARRIGELEADAAIVIGCDHYILFGTECLPPYVISMGEIEGPVDQLPGLKRKPLKSHGALGEHIARVGRATGFDWTVGRALNVDHSIAVPHQLMLEPSGRDIPIVAVMLACGVDPYLPMSRAWDLGEHIAEAVASFPGDERIVVIGSGGISHHVGDERMGEVNPEFDRKVLEIVTRGDKAAMLALTDEEILRDGGNGAMEIRQWACAMGAMAGAKGEVIDYAAVPEWVTGLGFVQLHA